MDTIATHRFVLEILSGDGHLAGHVALNPDWVPAVECTAFESLRRSPWERSLKTREARVTPVWDEACGAPYASGFAVRTSTDGELVPSIFRLTYFAEAAGAAAADFVERGLLEAGRSYHYRLCAYENDPPPPVEQRLVVDELDYTPPFEDGSLQSTRSLATGTGGVYEDGDCCVFIERHVLDEAVGLARRSPEREMGALLIGKLYRDPGTAEIFTAVTALIPAVHTVARSTSVTFTPETFLAAERAIELRGGNEIALGWAHSHLDWCRDCPDEKRRACTLSRPFFSRVDVAFQRTAFSRAYHIALLITDDRSPEMSRELFGWRWGVVAHRGFHVIPRFPFTSVRDNAVTDRPGIGQQP